MKQTVTLAHGNGGEENNTLIKRFYKAFKNEILTQSEDAAILPMPQEGKLALSTDSFTVSPLFFNGGNIGKLAICGTCNDLAMMAAKPKYMTCSVMIEEGFSIAELDQIITSMKEELAINGALVVSGDTKVVPKGSVDKLFINTTGIGEVEYSGVSCSNLKEGMRILVSRDIGAHGATIFATREGMSMQSSGLQSDCASLYPQVKALLDAGITPVALRDATRGGLSAVLNEWAKSSHVCLEIEEQQIPIQEEVKGICELLGFEAYNLANEGTFVLCVVESEVQKALEVLQQTHHNAALIGSVTGAYRDKVVLHSAWGTKRFLEMPTGELLPRIC
jgi:hydrogenase expression/formation protein HypE